MPKGIPVILPAPYLGYYPSQGIFSKDYAASLIDGVNVLIDREDFSISVRNGYKQLVTVPSGHRLTGGYHFVNESGISIVVVTTDKGWFYFKTGDKPPVLYDITNPSVKPTSSEKVSFGTFFQGGYVWVYGCTSADGVFRWRYGASTYEKVTAAPSLSDACTVAGRIVGIDSQYRRVRWSAINDMTTWPDLAYYGLPDLKDIIAVKPLAYDTAILFGDPYNYLIIFNPNGTDATAFTFYRMGKIIPVVSKTAVCQRGDLIYYVATDGKIYQTDGSSIRCITTKFDLPMYSKAENHSVYVIHSGYRDLIWFIFPRSADSFAMVYDPSLGIWNVPQVFSHKVEVAFDGYGVEYYFWGDFEGLSWRDMRLLFPRWKDMNDFYKVSVPYFCFGRTVSQMSGTVDIDKNISWYFCHYPVFFDHQSLVLVSSIQTIWDRPLNDPVNIMIGKQDYENSPVDWINFGSAEYEQNLNYLDDIPSKYVFVRMGYGKFIPQKYRGSILYAYQRLQMHSA